MSKEEEAVTGRDGTQLRRSPGTWQQVVESLEICLSAASVQNERFFFS